MCKFALSVKPQTCSKSKLLQPSFCKTWKYFSLLFHCATVTVRDSSKPGTTAANLCWHLENKMPQKCDRIYAPLSVEHILACAVKGRTVQSHSIKLIYHELSAEHLEMCKPGMIYSCGPFMVLWWLSCWCEKFSVWLRLGVSDFASAVLLFYLFIFCLAEASQELVKQKTLKRSSSTWHMLLPPTKEEGITAWL